MGQNGGNFHIGLIPTQSLDQAVLLGFQPLHTWTGFQRVLQASTAKAAAATAKPAPSKATDVTRAFAMTRGFVIEAAVEDDDEEDFDRQCELAFWHGKGKAKGWHKSACKDKGFSKGTSKGMDTAIKVKKTNPVVRQYDPCYLRDGNGGDRGDGGDDLGDGYGGSGSGSGSLSTG